MGPEQLKELIKNELAKQDSKFYALTATVAAILDVSNRFPEVGIAVSARLKKEYAESVEAGKNPVFLESFETMQQYLLRVAGRKHQAAMCPRHLRNLSSSRNIGLRSYGLSPPIPSRIGFSLQLTRLRAFLLSGLQNVLGILMQTWIRPKRDILTSMPPT